MSRLLLAAALALGLTGAFTSPAVAADEPAPAAKKESKGSISGKLLDRDGHAVAGAQVALVRAPDREARREKRLAREEQKPAADARKRAEPVAKTTTGQDGKFSLKDVPAGDYIIRTQLRGQGMAVAKVTVTPGKASDVSMTLKPAPGGKANRPQPTPEEKAQRRQQRKLEKKANQQ